MSAPPAYDVLVVGSGASGAMAAQTLGVDGLRVAVLDVGERDATYAPLVPATDFTTIRTTDPEQHAYFLGHRYEGIAWSDNRVGSQLTPPRGHLVRGVAERIPLVSDTFFPLESLAYGGLGGGWGVGCFVFSDSELERAGLPAAPMRAAYQVVADRIGISGAHDDAARHCLGDLTRIQPAPPLEANLAGLLAAYERRRARFNSDGFHLGRSALALLTEPKDGRAPTAGHDMDFWSDAGRSAYRSWITMDALRAADAVEYLGGRLVTSFEERPEGVVVDALRDDGSIERLGARRLVLAPGALGSARIVLRSLDGGAGRRLPLLSNPYTYMPCVQPRMLGRAIEPLKPSFSPLILYHEPLGDLDGEILQAAFFSYRSLLLFKLVREVPLPFRDARRIIHELLSSFTIAGVHHPDRGDGARTVGLVPHADSPTGDALAADYRLRADEQDANDAREALLAGALRRLGCFPLKKIRTPQGASIHYGGTLPAAAGAPFTLDGDGRLAGTRRIYVADGSGLRYLPAKGITLTLMANAHRVAAHVLETLRDA